MGCGLPKLEKPSENSPGKIYSTLKRAQVETKVGIAYEYKLLDFTTTQNEITTLSGGRLSSLQDLPAQLQELYQKGFVLTAFHPFVLPTDKQTITPEEQMFRAILIKPAVSSEDNHIKTEPCSLEVELCLQSEQLLNSKLLADVLQKVQEGSGKGIQFVGLVQRQYSKVNLAETIAETLVSSDSKEESKSVENVQNGVNTDESTENQEKEATNGESRQERSPEERSQSEGEQEQVKDEGQINGQALADSASGEDSGLMKNESLVSHKTEDKASDEEGVSLQAEKAKAAEGLQGGEAAGGEQSVIETSEHPEVEKNPGSIEADEITSESDPKSRKHEGQSSTGKPEEDGKKTGVENEFFVLFNKPQENQKCYKYYTATIPLKIFKKGQDINSIEADWLEHMTQHFTKGASLVDALICLGTLTDSASKSVDGLFIFQEISEGKCETYDAIVVEQWTVINGVEVKTDYVPLLNSLAIYGWRLTCVLPTPIVKRDSEGNLGTKQIVFLQRPSLPRKEKKRESKKKSAKDDKTSKQSKNCSKLKNGKLADANKAENQGQSTAGVEGKVNGDNENPLKAEEDEKESAAAAEPLQDSDCVQNTERQKAAETTGCAGEISVSENALDKGSDMKDIWEKEDLKDEREEIENKFWNDTSNRCEEEVSQAEIAAPVSGTYPGPSQELGIAPAEEAAAEASGETALPGTQITELVPEKEEDGTATFDGGNAGAE
ncbi:raftlin [Callorhinchus milii]|uniref:Raftlin n=1 Tax=Callorhinchus milii TaxID=7868 RepID=A0A4W3KGW5_CALMI|nr:raftlin [Callorhinchus milii]XP_042188320.1 raftlin [Callorhinchus milii]|eukprot:gi/632959731/ref/XP_007895790.1/ PREDICTED: raftlin [Callorhinchus milii]